MSEMQIGVNLEFIRSSDKGFRYGIEILRRHGYRGVLCVECGTIDQAERSLKYLRSVLDSSRGDPRA